MSHWTLTERASATDSPTARAGDMGITGIPSSPRSVSTHGSGLAIPLLALTCALLAIVVPLVVIAGADLWLARWAYRQLRPQQHVLSPNKEKVRSN